MKSQIGSKIQPSLHFHGIMYSRLLFYIVCFHPFIAGTAYHFVCMEAKKNPLFKQDSRSWAKRSVMNITIVTNLISEVSWNLGIKTILYYEFQVLNVIKSYCDEIMIINISPSTFKKMLLLKKRIMI